jgi:hypothetical protein
VRDDSVASAKSADMEPSAHVIETFRPRRRWLSTIVGALWLGVCAYLTWLVIASIDPVNSPVSILWAPVLIVFVTAGVLLVLFGLITRLELSSRGIVNLNCLGQTSESMRWSEVTAFEQQTTGRKRDGYIIRGKDETTINLHPNRYDWCKLEKAIQSRLSLTVHNQASSPEEDVVVGRG